MVLRKEQKKPGLQEWEATFTRTRLSDAIRA